MKDVDISTAQFTASDPGLVVPLFCFVAGLCMYAAFDHLIHAGRRRDNATQAVLTVMAFLIVGWAMVGMASYKAGNPNVHAMTLKWVLIFPILCQALFLWFVAFLTGVRPLSVLLTLTAAHAAMLGLHLASPIGLFFSDVKGLSLVQLPWGEAVVQPHATFGSWRGVVEVPTAIAAGYVIYACVRQFRRGETRQALALAVTATLVFAGNLHDLFVLSSTYVAPYGFLGTVLAVLICRSRLVRADLRGEAARDGAWAQGALPPESVPGISDRPYAVSPVGGTVLVLVLILGARWVESNLLRDVITLVAVLGIMLATVRVLYGVGSGKRVRRTLVVGISICVFSQLLAVTAELPVFEDVPLLGAASAYNASGREFFLLAGLLLLLNAFYYAGVEAGLMRRDLIREHHRLRQEVAERERVQEALKRNEAQLRASEKRFRALIQEGTDIIAALDGDGTLRFASASLHRVLGYRPESMVGRSVLEAIHPDELPMARDALADIMGPGGGLRRLELRVRHRDGSWRTLEGIARGMPDDPILHGVILNARDVTERRQVEERLESIKRQEQERIHRDLHDSIGQDLTGLRCMADSLARRLHALELPEARRADGIVEGIRRAMVDVHAAIKGIAPVDPDPDGLRVALEQLTARTGAENGIDVHLDCPVPVGIDDNSTATHLFRIAQEALTNAVRHGRPSHVAVSLARDGDRIRLAVCDNGVGINGGASEGSGVGMRTMRDRAEAIGAVLSIGPGDFGGTCVSCTLSGEAGQRLVQQQQPGDFSAWKPPSIGAEF